MKNNHENWKSEKFMMYVLYRRKGNHMRPEFSYVQYYTQTLNINFMITIQTEMKILYKLVIRKIEATTQ